MDLGDVDFGDVLSDVDGVLVVEGVASDTDVVVKRYAEESRRREIASYALLRRLGVPTLQVLGAGDDWLILQALDGFEWRTAQPGDLNDPAVLRSLAAWYDALHRAAARLTADDARWLGRASDLLSGSALSTVGAMWPELEPGLAWARRHLPEWLAEEAAGVPTLNHNDFALSHLAIGWEASEVLVLEPGRISLGCREVDLSAVAAALEPEAAALFRAESDRLLALRGGRPDPVASAVEPRAHLSALVAAADGGGGLSWGVVDSYAWLAAHC